MIEVVEPKLKLAIDGPDERFTDTIADYTITVQNPGTAPARKVRVLATLPISGRFTSTRPRRDMTRRQASSTGPSINWIQAPNHSRSRSR